MAKIERGLLELHYSWLGRFMHPILAFSRFVSIRWSGTTRTARIEWKSETKSKAKLVWHLSNYLANKAR